jgi:hypothetical protein
MDLWGMAGVSRQVLALGLVAGLAAAVLVARAALRRHERNDRVRMNLSGRE